MLIKPMLASPMKKSDVVTNWADWAIEEKYDGHRLIVHIADAVHGMEISAFARPRGDGRMIQRDLPDHLVAALEQLPAGIYDGELLAGDISTDVSRLDLAHTQRFVIFDVLDIEAHHVMEFAYDDRRSLLTRLTRNLKGTVVSVAPSINLTDERDVTRFVKAVWKTGGEGAILKRRKSPYAAGKRNTDWIKIKRVEHAALTVVGFEPTRGTVMNRGPFAVVILEDEEGNRTTCKTKDDFELNRLNRAYEGVTPNDGMARWTTKFDASKHPWIGKRKLVIEFQQRTRDGGYRGPVLWDRWEDE